VTPIPSVSVNLFNGLFAQTILFQPGLNIIAGENGTGKTNLLRQIKDSLNPNQGMPGRRQDAAGIRIMAISPKRNSQRRDLQSVIGEFRQQNKTFDTFVNERLNFQLNDAIFDNYPAFGDLFLSIYFQQCKDGGPQIDKMNAITEEFNSVIGKVFTDYELVSKWDDKAGAPSIFLNKYHHSQLPLSGLSCGEQEVLSLVLSLYTFRDSYQAFLIDEPEVHLNWHLEDKLFDYFDDFCDIHNRQIITCTHSRAIFKDRFLKKTQFLCWRDNKIVVAKDLTDDQRRRIAGEAIDIIKLGDFANPTFFVEDKTHKETLQILADKLSATIAIVEAGDSPNVKTIYKLSKSAPSGWSNSYFIIDNDNMGNPYPTDPLFIHLDKYCIENYFLQIDILQKIINRTEAETKELLLQIIRSKRNNILKFNKYLSFVFDRICTDDIIQSAIDRFDGSEILPPLLKEAGMDASTFMHKYLELVIADNRLELIFPTALIAAISSGIPKTNTAV
jgi:hypothetical protein